MTIDARMRILFAPETFNLGETTRAIEVAQAVRDAGHEVLFMGYSRRFASHVVEAGFRLELLEPELSEHDADLLMAVDQGRGVKHPFTLEMVRRRVRSERSLIQAWRPHAVVIGTTLTLFISARAERAALAYVRPYALSKGHLSQMTSFPITSGLGVLAKSVNRAAGVTVRLVAGAVRWMPQSFRRVAFENEVRLPSRTLDAIDADLNLIASLFPYLDQRQLAPGEVAVGPIYAQSAGQLPERVRRLASRTRPAVYVGLGSSANRKLALTLLRQVATLDIDVISTAGRYLSDTDRATLPDNVDVYDHLPAHFLAGLIDASVTHGGEGTVQTACASGVPFAGIGLQAEQRINIDECVRYGNALRVTSLDLAHGRLPAIVTRLLTDIQLRDAAIRLQKTIEPVGSSNSAEAIIALVRGTSGSPT